jgi:hypothetical protein
MIAMLVRLSLIRSASRIVGATFSVVNRRHLTGIDLPLSEVRKTARAAIGLRRQCRRSRNVPAPDKHLT